MIMQYHWISIYLVKDKFFNLYKIVSFTGNRLYAIPICVATTIVNKVEYTQLNKIEFTKEKDLLVKLNVDRLGNLIKV